MLRSLEFIFPFYWFGNEQGIVLKYTAAIFFRRVDWFRQKFGKRPTFDSDVEFNRMKLWSVSQWLTLITKFFIWTKNILKEN